MAPKLRAIGVAKVRGFALNATHQDWTNRNAAYGARLSRLVGGKHFVINTSHNGNGPSHRRVWVNRRRKHLWRIENEWCNPPKAVLGERPTRRHRPGAGGRLPLDRAARLLQRRLQRRPGPRWARGGGRRH